MYMYINSKDPSSPSSISHFGVLIYYMNGLLLFIPHTFKAGLTI